MLNSKSSAIPGKWSNDMTPYLVDIMNEFSNMETEEIVFVKPTQVGGTEASMNALGYIIMQDPSPTLVVYPDKELGSSVGENRIEPMIWDSPELTKLYDKRNSDKLEFQFKNDMFIGLAGSNSASGLASKPIRFLILDEVDKYPGASKKESDPISLARERTKTFKNNKKIYITSTPTIKSGHIWRAKESSDIEKHYVVPCPHCGTMIELVFKQIKWPSKDNLLSDADRAEHAYYECQECHGIINDRHKPNMLKHGKWEIVKQNTKFVKKVCYWMNTLYSPFVSFSDIAREWLMSQGDNDKLRNFYNSWLAEIWEETKQKRDKDVVLERQTMLEAFIVPNWAKLLTAGVDVQENCLYWTIRAFGNFITSQNVAHGQAFSWSEIEKIMNAEYKKENGQTMVVDLCLIDSGDQTDDVYDFCSFNSEWALPVKGSSKTMMTHYKVSKVNKAASRAYGMQLIIVDGGKYKDMIYSRMNRENSKQGAWMVYRDCDEDYANQVTAEEKIIEKNASGVEVSKWQKKSSHADNHYLDAEVYALAAADLLNVRMLFLEDEKDDEEEQKPQACQEQHMPEENWINSNEKWV